MMTLVGCGPAVESGDEQSATAGPGSSSGGVADTSGSESDPGPSTAPVTTSPATSEATTGDEGDGSSSTDGVVGGDQYYVSIATIVAETTPLQFLGTVKVEGGAVGMSLTPLSLDVGAVDSPRELVPPAIEFGGEAEPDGLITIVAPEVQVVGAVNPITGSDLVADLTIQVEFVGDLLCGRVSGMVVVPANIDLTGSTFAAMPVALGPNPAPGDIPLPSDIGCP